MIEEDTLDPIGRAMIRMGVLAYGLTADREWVAILVAQGDENGSAHRSYVRVMMAFIEGMTFVIKKLLLAIHRQTDLGLSDAETALLEEIQFALDGKGRAMTKPRLMRIKDNIRFTMNLLGRCAKPPFKPNYGDDGWQAFCEAIAIRNRVTHPKTRDDLWITQGDLERIDRGVKWFEDETARYLQNFR
jgi:hypothetical protein